MKISWKPVFAVMVLLLTCFTALAQDKPKQALSVYGLYNREDNTLKDVNGDALKFNPAADAVGGGVSWDIHPGNKAFFMGMQGEVAFHNKELENIVISCGTGCVVSSIGKVSKIQKGAFDYRAGLADRTGTFQPSIAGLIGLENSNFGGENGPKVRRGSRFRYGGIATFDLCGGASKRTCFRTAFQLTKKFNVDTTGWDATVKLGIVWKFGGK